MTSSSNRRRVSYWTVLIIASLFVVAIGAQAYIAQQDNEDRDAEDKAYAECLTEFSTDLVTTIRERTTAAAQLEKVAKVRDAAEREKDRALDQLIQVIVDQRKVPPEAGPADFQRALERRVAAQERYREAQETYRAEARQLGEVRDMNEYVTPEVVCSR